MTMCECTFTVRHILAEKIQFLVLPSLLYFHGKGEFILTQTVLYIPPTVPTVYKLVQVLNLCLL